MLIKKIVIGIIAIVSIVMLAVSIVLNDSKKTVYEKKENLQLMCIDSDAMWFESKDRKIVRLNCESLGCKYDLEIGDSLKLEWKLHEGPGNSLVRIAAAHQLIIYKSNTPKAKENNCAVYRVSWKD